MFGIEPKNGGFWTGYFHTLLSCLVSEGNVGFHSVIVRMPEI